MSYKYIFCFSFFYPLMNLCCTVQVPKTGRREIDEETRIQGCTISCIPRGNVLSKRIWLFKSFIVSLPYGKECIVLNLTYIVQDTWRCYHDNNRGYLHVWKSDKPAFPLSKGIFNTLLGSIGNWIIFFILGVVLFSGYSFINQGSKGYAVSPIITGFIFCPHISSSTFCGKSVLLCCFPFQRFWNLKEHVHRVHCLANLSQHLCTEAVNKTCIGFRIGFWIGSDSGSDRIGSDWYRRFWCRTIILTKSCFNNDTGGSDFFLSTRMCQNNGSDI